MGGAPLVFRWYTGRIFESRAVGTVVQDADITRQPGAALKLQVGRRASHSVSVLVRAMWPSISALGLTVRSKVVRLRATMPKVGR